MATGGGPPAGGYGRGGRGLAILEALKKEQVGTAFFATPAALLNSRSRTECITSTVVVINGHKAISDLYIEVKLRRSVFCGNICRNQS